MTASLPARGTDPWDVQLGTWLDVAHNADGTLTSPPATQTVYVSLGANASDSNDGFSPWLPKSTPSSAVAALGGNPGVVQCLYGTISMVGVALAAGQKLRGLGVAATTLHVGTDAGTGHYATDCSASLDATPIVLEDLTLLGPGTGFVIGTPPANMSGVKTGPKMKMVRCRVLQFYAGVEIAAHHETFNQCTFTSNYYNTYETAASGTFGNQVFVACDLTGATRASLVASGAGMYDSCSFINTHVGFAPIGIYKEAYTSNHSLLVDSWADIAFEACGNACIYQESLTASDRTVANVAFFGPVFTVSSDPTYHDAGLPSDAAVSVSGACTFQCIRDRSSGPGIATTIFKTTNAGVQSVVITDRSPVATDFAGNWIGSQFTVQIGSGALARATVCQANATITTGQVLQLQNQASGVYPFGGNNSNSYCGVAAYSAVNTAMVAVWTEGVVNVLCSEHVTFANVRLEIDPATPAQVRVINADIGTTFAPTTQVPSRYPVIGIANGPNSAINTLLPVWLYPAPHTDPDYVHPGPVSALPAAGAGNVGQMLTLLGNHTTTADVTYVCEETAAATFVWTQVANGTALTIGNGAATNLTALAKSTGTGPASLAVVGWETVVIGATTYYRPLFQ